MYRRSFETISVRPYLATLAVLCVLWFLIAGWITNRHMVWQGWEMAMQAALKTQEDHKRFDNGLQSVVDILCAVPETLSRDADIRHLLEASNLERKTQVASFLTRLAREIRFAHSFYVLDNRGQIIASGYTNEGDAQDNKTRFPSALQPGKAGVQYMISDAGEGELYFVAPVYNKGQLRGAVASRIEWSGLANLMGRAIGFIVDQQGVVVAAVRPDFLLTTMPSATVHALPESDRMASYGKVTFPDWPLVLVREDEGVPFFSLDEKSGLYFLHTFHLPGGELRLMVADIVPAPSSWQPFFLVSLVCGWLGILVVIGTIYHFRQKRVAAYNLQQQDALKKMVIHDALTGTYNRIAAERLLEQACAQAEKNSTGCALLFVDLDKFKEINDKYGHSAGDIVLRETGTRLQACVRHSDSVVRYGGDEFLVILSSICHAGHVANIASTMLTELKRPISTADETLYISASIGIAMYPHDGRNFEELAGRADEALYRAKSEGRARFVFYANKDTDHQASEDTPQDMVFTPLAEKEKE